MSTYTTARSINVCPENSPETNSANLKAWLEAQPFYATGMLLFEVGVYQFAATIEVIRPVIFQGAHGNHNGWDGGTCFKFPRGVDGVKMAYVGDYAGPPPPTGGYNAAFYATLRDVNINSSLPVTGVPAANGVIVNCHSKLENVTVAWFSGNGFYINGNALASPRTNANNWAIEYCRAIVNGGDGLRVEGPNADAGICIGLDVSQNLGWGIYDNSFLGNTYTGCHAASNGKGPYYATNPNARNVFLGCYSEAGGPGSVITKPSMVIGGIHGAGVWGNTTQLLSNYLVNAWALSEVDEEWRSGVSYGAGNKVRNQGNIYTCVTPGTSASSGSGPTGTGSAIVDGSVAWRWSFVDPIRVTSGNRVTSRVELGSTSSNDGGKPDFFRLVSYDESLPVVMSYDYLQSPPQKPTILSTLRGAGRSRSRASSRSWSRTRCGRAPGIRC